MSLLIIGPELTGIALEAGRKLDALKLRKAVFTQEDDPTSEEVVLEIKFRDRKDGCYGRRVRVPRRLIAESKTDIVQGWRHAILEEALTYIAEKERIEPGSFLGWEPPS